MGNYCVYEHVSPSGKRYIGITSQNPERRWRADGSGYRQNPHFMNAIKKYGWKNFTHNILYSGLTKDEACKLEKLLIKELKTSKCRSGYNRSLGGEYGKLTPEARKQISESVKELWTDDAYRKHMSEAHKGQRRTGWKQSEEARQKMSEIVRKRMSDPAYRAKLSKSAQKRCSSEEQRELYGKRAKAMWKDPELRARLTDAKRGNHYRAKKVRCIETGEIFESVTTAAASIGQTRESVGMVCKGIHKTSGKLHWEFYDGE